MKHSDDEFHAEEAVETAEEPVTAEASVEETAEEPEIEGNKGIQSEEVAEEIPGGGSFCGAESGKGRRTGDCDWLDCADCDCGVCVDEPNGKSC